MNFSSENYLKIIFKLQYSENLSNRSVKPLSISRELGVSPAAVTDMLKKLSDDGYTNHAPYKGVSLTKKGIEKGREMVRRHRIWELYLQQILGYSWGEVHQEAELLEHASSERLINRLEELLGFPKYDPHGDPIPSKEGVFPEIVHSAPLADCSAGDLVSVVRVSDFDPQFLHYIDSLDIHLGKEISILTIRSFDRSMLIEIGGRQESLSALASQYIFVRTIKNNIENSDVSITISKDKNQ